MPGALSEVAMSCIVSRVLAVLCFAICLGAAGKASAQAGCQPTLTQPCAKISDKAGGQPSARKDAAQSDDADEPKDHSPRIKLDKDTEFKFGTGGIGLGRKF